MNTNLNNQTLLYEAMAFSLGGIFLLTLNANLTLHVFGWIFIAFALLLIVESFINKISLLHNRIQTLLVYPLFIVTIADFITKAIDSHQSVYIVLTVIFLLILLVAILYQIAILHQTSR